MAQNTRRVTIKEVAELANVAVGTVSRYINSNGYVSSEAAERIKSAIEKLEFIPNAAARSMIRKRSAIIGVAVPEINNPFLADLVVQIDAAVSKMNYSIMLCNTQYQEKKIATFIDDLIMRDAEGLVVIATDINDPDQLKKMRSYLYTVSIGHCIEGFDCITLTDYRAAYDLTVHLISLGHRNIAFLGFNKNAQQTMYRLDGYCAALTEHGLPLQNELMRESYAGPKDGYHLAKELLSLPVPPTAMIAVNDFYAMNAYSAVADAGLKVGRDVSITGFDDVFIAKFLSPALTTVRCDSDEIVQKAMEMIGRHIARNEATAPAEVVLKSTIVFRESTVAATP